jgi:hypothetical protein
MGKMRELWSNRPFPTPSTAGQSGMKGGTDMGEKETADSLGAKVTTVDVGGGGRGSVSGPAKE